MCTLALQVVTYHLKKRLRGQGQGVSWGQIMENEFECLTYRRGLGGYFSEEFVKKNYS